MHGAAIGDFQHALALCVGQVAGQGDLPLEDVDNLIGGCTVRCLRGCGPGDASMVQLHLHVIQLQALAVGVHADGHGGAGAQGREQQRVGVGTQVGAAHGFGLVGYQGMATGLQATQELVIQFGDEDMAGSQVRVDRNGRDLGFGAAGLDSRVQVARGPGDDAAGDVFGVFGAREQVVGAVQRDEALGVAGGFVDFLGLLDGDRGVLR